MSRSKAHLPCGGGGGGSGGGGGGAKKRSRSATADYSESFKRLVIVKEAPVLRDSVRFRARGFAFT